MQRRSNIKFNSAGLAGCASLLFLLMVMLMAPLVPSSAYADDNVNRDSGVAATADDTRYETSTVGIDFTRGVTSGADGSSVTAPSVTPMKDGDGKSRVTIDTKVSVTNSAKYEVYIGSDSEYLRKDGTSNTDRLNPISGNPTYDNIGINEWGYAWAPKDSFNEKTVTYSAMPGTVRGTAFDSNDDLEATNGEDEREYTISFAANFGTGVTSGVYSSKVTLSVISNPTEVAAVSFMDTSITEMQQMTNGVCEASTVGDEKQLKDTRDGKYYWVAKMADDRCWMTQNLDLDLFDDVNLTNQNTNITAATWKPASGQGTTTDSSTIHADNNGQWSWSMGGPVIKPVNGTTTGATDYYTANPDSTTSCGSTLTGASACPNEANGKWTQMSIPTSAGGANADKAHYLLGNLYQWGAATAGQSTTSITSGESQTSICPYGWKLPTSTASGEFQALVTALGAGSDVSKLTNKSDEPGKSFYAVRGGRFTQNTSDKFQNIGNYGRYWSSTAYDGSQAYILVFYNTDSVNPSANATRQVGYSVRCINNPNVQ